MHPPHTQHHNPHPHTAGAVDSIVSFEGPLQLSRTEGGPNPDVCVSINALPLPGQTVRATYNTIANTATGASVCV